MFGKESEEGKLQKAMRQVGADPSAVRGWFKTLEKMKKSAPSVRTDYEKALNSTEQLTAILEKMERVLAGTDGQLKERELQLLRDAQKEMENLKGCCDHSFVVSPDDREFHLTFETLLKMETGGMEDSEHALIFQSEVENLLALSRESLEREHPSLARLCYYYVNRTDRDLEKLPPAERLAKIQRVYQNEFIQGMRSMLTDCIAEAYRLRKASGHLDKHLEILLSKEKTESENGLWMEKTRKDFEKQADDFLISLCSLE